MRMPAQAPLSARDHTASRMDRKTPTDPDAQRPVQAHKIQRRVKGPPSADSFLPAADLRLL